MSQKLPFNKISTPITQVPITADLLGATLFHTFAATPLRPEGAQKPASQAAPLWELFLWCATGDISHTFSVFAVPQGEPIPSAVGQVAFGVPEVKTIFQLANGLPIRGPLDLYIAAAVGAGTPASFWGYVSRGTPDTLKEKRFLTGSNIGDQETDFTGGAGIILLASEADKLIHEVDGDGYNDEITLDVREAAVAAAAGVEVQVFFETGPSILYEVAEGEAQRIFDGVPFRNGGELKATNLDAEDPLLFTGGFVRA